MSNFEVKRTMDTDSEAYAVKDQQSSFVCSCDFDAHDRSIYGDDAGGINCFATERLLANSTQKGRWLRRQRHRR